MTMLLDKLIDQFSLAKKASAFFVCWARSVTLRMVRSIPGHRARAFFRSTKAVSEIWPTRNLSRDTEPYPRLRACTDKKSPEKAVPDTFCPSRRSMMVVLGIDIGKREVFVNLQTGDGSSAPQALGQRGPIANTATGFQQLTAWLIDLV